MNYSLLGVNITQHDSARYGQKWSKCETKENDYWREIFSSSTLSAFNFLSLKFLNADGYRLIGNLTAHEGEVNLTAEPNPQRK